MSACVRVIKSWGQLLPSTGRCLSPGFGDVSFVRPPTDTHTHTHTHTHTQRLRSSRMSVPASHQWQPDLEKLQVCAMYPSTAPVDVAATSCARVKTRRISDPSFRRDVAGHFCCQMSAESMVAQDHKSQNMFLMSNTADAHDQRVLALHRWGRWCRCRFWTCGGSTSCWCQLWQSTTCIFTARWPPPPRRPAAPAPYLVVFQMGGQNICMHACVRVLRGGELGFFRAAGRIAGRRGRPVTLAVKRSAVLHPRAAARARPEASGGACCDSVLPGHPPPPPACLRSSH